MFSANYLKCQLNSDDQLFNLNSMKRASYVKNSINFGIYVKLNAFESNVQYICMRTRDVHILSNISY